MSGWGCTDWSEAGIAAELLALQRWVAWRFVERDRRATKVPINAMTGGAASSTDKTTWSDYAAAARYARTHGCGVGIMLGGRLVGIDLDACITTGIIEPGALNIVHSLFSYTERSPSGTGLHILCWGELPVGRRRKGQVEMYDRDRFFCMTGDHVEGSPHSVMARTAELVDLHARVFGPAAPIRPTQTPANTHSLSLTDEDVIARARRARNGAKFEHLWSGDLSGYTSGSEADCALVSMLSFYTQDAAQLGRLLRASGLSRQKHERADYMERTVAAALAAAGVRHEARTSWLERTVGEFL